MRWRVLGKSHLLKWVPATVCIMSYTQNTISFCVCVCVCVRACACVCMRVMFHPIFNLFLLHFCMLCKCEDNLWLLSHALVCACVCVMFLSSDSERMRAFSTRCEFMYPCVGFCVREWVTEKCVCVSEEEIDLSSWFECVSHWSSGRSGPSAGGTSTQPDDLPQGGFTIMIDLSQLYSLTTWICAEAVMR